ncbi:MAG: ribosomal-processing cysteine protease Prp [Ruminococcus sp.]|nr:ribosomal-processing cysteine protease Prp [Ruminococcus sp.]
MIRAEFYESDGLMSGFSFSGHADYADIGSDVVCAAVSSAVQLTANLLEDFDFSPDVKVGNNIVKCCVSKGNSSSDKIIFALKNHLEAILDEYPKTIKITTLEV